MVKYWKRLSAALLCLALLLGSFPAARAEEAELYLQPLSGGVAQVELHNDHIAVLRSDGTVAAVGDNDRNQCQVSEWTSVVKILAGEGYTVGLTREGGVLTTFADLPKWTDIAQVGVEYLEDRDMYLVAAMRLDGTALCAAIRDGQILPFGKGVCDVSGWTELVQLVVQDRIFGLRADGTVVETGFAFNEEAGVGVEEWQDVRELIPTDYGIFGITREGGVLSQNPYYGCEVWQQVVTVLPGYLNCVYGITADGSVYAGGEVTWDCAGLTDVKTLAVGPVTRYTLHSDGTVEIMPKPKLTWTQWEQWKGIRDLVWDNGGPYLAALKQDGTVMGIALEDLSEPAPCDGWRDITHLYCLGETFLGIKKNGSLVCTRTDWDLEPLTKGIRDTRPRDELQGLLAAGTYHSVWVQPDGTILAAGQSTQGRLRVTKWTDIVQVAASEHTVGLHADGTVTAVGPDDYGQCGVRSWSNIVDIDAGNGNTVGLTDRGIMLVAGSDEYGQLSLSGRRNVVDVAAGGSAVYAVTDKGTVMAAGSNGYGQCNVTGWSAVTAISAGVDHVVALRADGTVVAAGRNQHGQCNVSSWRDIVAVSAGGTHTIGLRSDGTVVYAGSNAFGQCNVRSWANVVTVTTGMYHTLALTADGKLLVTGSNGHGQCDLE